MKTNESTIKTTSTTQNKSGSIKRFILSGAMALSLFTSAGFMGIATHAEARVNGPRLDSLTFQCGALQDRRDQIWDEYTDASPAKREQLMTELSGIIQNWIAICMGTFGPIGARTAQEQGILVHVPNVDVVQENPTATPGKHGLEITKLPVTSRSLN
jgi:hypothetical protein